MSLTPQPLQTAQASLRTPCAFKTVTSLLWQGRRHSAGWTKNTELAETGACCSGPRSHCPRHSCLEDRERCAALGWWWTPGDKACGTTPHLSPSAARRRPSTAPAPVDCRVAGPSECRVPKHDRKHSNFQGNQLKLWPHIMSHHL